MGFNDRTIVKSTRKEHVCLGCLEAIPVGSKAVYNKGKNQGEWYTYYLHELCEDVYFKYRDSVIFWDGLPEGYVKELVSHYGLSREGLLGNDITF